MKNNFLSNVFRVLFSNILLLFSGVLSSLVIPKIMTVDNYGLYKIYTLYSTYLTFFSLGFVDGIYILYGSKDYEDLDRSKFSMFTKFYLLSQFIFVLLGIGLSFFIKQNSIIVILLSISIFSLNVSGYYQQLSQITQRFKELSLRNTIRSVLTTIILIILFCIFYFYSYNVNSYFYIIIVLFLDMSLTLWYIITYRDILFNKSKFNTKEILQIFKVGIPLFLSNFILIVFFAMDKQVISINFTNEEYGIYAFSFNIYSLFNTIISSISTVIYPKLMRMSNDDKKSNFKFLYPTMLILSASMLLGYYPITFLIKLILPEYIPSIHFIRLIFPLIILIAPINIIIHNYYKIFNLNVQFLIYTSIFLIIGYPALYIVSYIYESMDIISIVYLVVLLLWNLFTTIYLFVKFKEPYIKNILILLSLIAIYYITTTFQWFIGFPLYLISIIFIVLFFYKNIYKQVIYFFK